MQIQVHPGSDLDPHNPTFQAAQNACQHYLPGANGGGQFSIQGNGGPSSSGNGGSGTSSNGGSIK